jgi:acyl-CoA dehydrogenase
MHQIKTAMLLTETDHFTLSLLRRVASEQLLIGSVTSEEGVGGSVRTSICAVKPNVGSNTFALTKRATTISYGGFADILSITARRSEASQAADQVLVTVTRDQYSLERTSIWDTLGMRGTCSDGYILTTSADLSQICPTSFGELAESIMLPVSHMLWASVWLGIATDACTRARAFLREQTKKSGGTPPPGSNRLVNALNNVQFMHARIKNALSLYEAMQKVARLPAVSVGFTTEMNGLKLSISEMALEVIDEAMMICGISGFKNGTPYSLGRHLRDIHSARLMISNDRIAGNMAGFFIVQRSPVVVF